MATTYISPGNSRAWAQNLTINLPGISVTNVAEIIQDSVPPLTTVNVFTGGQIVAVRNGTSLAGATHFYLRGYLVAF